MPRRKKLYTVGDKAGRAHTWSTFETGKNGARAPERERGIGTRVTQLEKNNRNLKGLDFLCADCIGNFRPKKTLACFVCIIPPHSSI